MKQKQFLWWCQKIAATKYVSYSSAINNTFWGIFINWFLYTLNIYMQEVYHHMASDE